MPVAKFADVETIHNYTVTPDSASTAQIVEPCFGKPNWSLNSKVDYIVNQASYRNIDFTL